MVIPREHGAWGMLLVPLATGAVVALRSGVNGSALALFLRCCHVALLAAHAGRELAGHFADQSAERT